MNNNNNNIQRFFFAQNKNACVRNYAGLIDAIYILFFGGDLDCQSNFDNLLNILRGLNMEETESLVSEVHSSFDEDDYKADCAHLVFMDSDKKISGNPDAYALRVPINSSKSTFSSKSQGQKNGYTYNNELNVVFEGRSSQVSELQYALMHTSLKIGVLFRDSNGDARIMVDPDYPMDIETSEESGEGPSGTASASIKFTQVSKLPPIYYRGSMRFSDVISKNTSSTGYMDFSNVPRSPEIEVPGG